MYYTLKCDAATTQDNYACGEWDYTTYTRLFNHQNVNSPYYYYRNSNPETIQYNDQPKYDIQQNFSYNLSIDSTISQNSFTIGTGLENTTELLNTTQKSGQQYSQSLQILHLNKTIFLSFTTILSTITLQG